MKAATSYGPPHEQYRSVQGVANLFGESLAAMDFLKAGIRDLNDS